MSHAAEHLNDTSTKYHSRTQEEVIEVITKDKPSSNIPKQINIVQNNKLTLETEHIDSTTNSLSDSIKDDYSGSHSVRQKQQPFNEYYETFLGHDDCTNSRRSVFNNNNN